MYANSSTSRSEGRRPPYSDEAREIQPLRGALEAAGRVRDRVLFVLGAICLVLVVPALWLWIAYGGARSPAFVWAAGIGLAALAAGLGLALNRLLDGR